MKTDVAGQYCFDLKEGTVYVTVGSATDDEPRGYRPLRSDMKLTPVMEIHTGQNPRNAEDSPGFVKLRGREYAISVSMSPSPRAFEYEDGYVSRWDRRTQREGYRSGYLTENLVPIDYKSPTKVKLSRLAESVAEMMDSEHPEWRLDSLRVRLQWECDAEASEIVTAREQIAKSEDRTRALMTRMETLTAQDGWTR